MIRRASGKVDEVGEDIAGFPLGIMPGSNYQQTGGHAHPGDVVVVYSDGVTDARNLREELYDSRESAACSRNVADTSGGPETVGRAILQDIREFSAGHAQVDDITLICFGPSPSSLTVRNRLKLCPAGRCGHSLPSSMTSSCDVGQTQQYSPRAR